MFPGPGALYDLLTNFNVSLNWLIGNKGPMYYKEEAQPADPTGLKTVLSSEEVKGLLLHMERIPLLRHEVLSFFYKFKLDYKRPGGVFYKRYHRGDGIPNLILLQEYAHARGKILE